MWKCSGCGEQVEDEFGTCWNCQLDKNGELPQSSISSKEIEPMYILTTGEIVTRSNTKFIDSSDDYYAEQYAKVRLAALNSGQASCDKCGSTYSISDMIGREWKAADRKVSTEYSIPTDNRFYRLITRYEPVEPPVIIAVWVCKSCINKTKNFRAIMVASILTVVIIICDLLTFALFSPYLSNSPGAVVAVMIFVNLFFVGLLIFSWFVAIRVFTKPILDDQGEIVYTIGAGPPLLTMSQLMTPYCQKKLKATGHDYGYALGEGEDVLSSIWKAPAG